MTAVAHNRPLLGVTFMSLGMLCISVNDMVVKALSGDYPLHQLVFIRAGIGLVIAAILVRVEVGWRGLRVHQPGLHVARAGLIVLANLSLYASIATIPLATATAIYFVAPLFVTLLAIPVLGEAVGPRRIAAVAVGFLGVLVILSPELDGSAGFGPVVILPVIAAAGYAAMSVLTRKLGARASASVLSFYIQLAFLLTGALFFVIAGDGRFATLSTSPSAQFLLRAWVWPAPEDYAFIALLGALSGVVGYAMSQAYRMASASTVAPFEYVLMLYALFWGWTVFGEWPTPTVFLGAAIIIASGVFIVLRERMA